MNSEPTCTGWRDKGVEDLRNVDLAVVIGRFQPVHQGHINLFKRAAQISKNRLILVGSSFIARNIKNPFTYDERRNMIKAACSELRSGDFNIAPITDDLYNDTVWIGNVQTEIDIQLHKLGLDPKTARVAIVGHHKDDSSYYLDMFPNYIMVEVQSQETISSTAVRELMFTEGGFHKDLPQVTRDYLDAWVQNDPSIFANLVQEHKFLTNYRKQFAELPYPPIFVTVDAVVINHGHILLVKRRSHPGKGLWALPGGHLNQNEFIESAIIRELKEETRIGVSDLSLRAALQGTHVFDAPNRSLRGRTITHAGLFVFNLPNNPKVRGDDDAEKARWVPISQFYEMSAQLFEDHASIGTYMITRAG